jgi:hypothetical protein
MAALSAVTLDATLRKSTSLDGVSKSFNDTMAYRLFIPWLLPRISDYTFENTVPIEGEKKDHFFFQAARRALKAMFQLTHTDPYVLQQVLKIFTMSAFAGDVVIQPLLLFKLIPKLLRKN